VPDRKPLHRKHCSGFRRFSGDEELMAEAARGRESAEIRALEHKAVEIFAQEMVPDPVAEIFLKTWRL
jgi:hypothetical protein